MAMLTACLVPFECCLSISNERAECTKFHKCTQPELKKVAKEPAFVFLNERLEERKGKGMKLYNVQRTATKGEIPRGELKRRFSRLLQFFFLGPAVSSSWGLLERKFHGGGFSARKETDGILSVKLKLWFDIQSNVVGPAVQGRSQDHCSLSVEQAGER